MKLKIKSKKGLVGIIVIAIILGIMLAVCLINNKNAKSDKTLMEYLRQVLQLEKDQDKFISIGGDNDDISVVPTMKDKISEDATWCPTFQLIWNDMVNKVVGKDIVFTTNQETMADNLNKQEFTEDMISDELYFKIYGKKTLELKNEISEGIKQKFNESSSVLDDIDWSEDSLDSKEDGIDKYIFYAMLKREFNFEEDFDILEPSTFGFDYENVQYFGINENSSKTLASQVKVLYYDSPNKFAIELSTKEGDKLIFVKGDNSDTFEEIYNNTMEKQKDYDESSLRDDECLKIPNLKFKEKREYTELENKTFETNHDTIALIEKAVQTVEFELNNKGGKVKSEAIVELQDSFAEVRQPRQFNLDNRFTMFIKEEDKELPYFATKICDITLYQ